MSICTEARNTLNALIESCGEDYFEFFEEINGDGICLSCGNIQGGTEPDAEGYQCHDCGEDTVMGIEQALMILC